ncbi:MAG: Asp-tRNA(Asn)/Glu-tRNA(Gln) amidotransferase subunit GatA, partial [Selenomonadaceae bacterium]|nr:Asp-tRNA(Asn)/Glu-tRNA(Gln) amidotransferase subunit GatA [Selenomonadaceae bacterium]
MRLYDKPAHVLHDMLVKKEITSVELTKDVISRIDEVEDDVKAYLSRTRDEALKQAEAADA